MKDKIRVMANIQCCNIRTGLIHNIALDPAVTFDQTETFCCIICETIKASMRHPVIENCEELSFDVELSCDGAEHLFSKTVEKDKDSGWGDLSIQIDYTANMLAFEVEKAIAFEILQKL